MNKPYDIVPQYINATLLMETRKRDKTSLESLEMAWKDTILSSLNLLAKLELQKFFTFGWDYFTIFKTEIFITLSFELAHTTAHATWVKQWATDNFIFFGAMENQNGFQVKVRKTAGFTLRSTCSQVQCALGECSRAYSEITSIMQRPQLHINLIAREQHAFFDRRKQREIRHRHAS